MSGKNSTEFKSVDKALRAVHHIALWPRDLESSIRFYRDGLGLKVLNDLQVEGRFDEWFGVPSPKVRSLFLGDPTRSDFGKLELLSFEDVDAVPEMSRSPILLISFAADVLETANRIRKAGFDTVKVYEHRGGHLGVARDPDGIIVELIEKTPIPNPS